jgi:Flp pilus assembly protein TadG
MFVKGMRKFPKAEGGTAAIEFAIVAPIFFMILFGIVEYSIFVWKRSVLRYVVAEASREIQTGEIQKDPDPENAFKAAYCSFAPTLLDCTKLHFDVRAYAALGDVVFAELTIDQNGDPVDFQFDPGEGDEIVAVRAVFPHNFITPVLADIFQPSGQPVILIGYSIAKNEPFAS